MTLHLSVPPAEEFATPEWGFIATAPLLQKVMMTLQANSADKYDNHVERHLHNVIHLVAIEWLLNNDVHKQYHKWTLT